MTFVWRTYLCTVMLTGSHGQGGYRQPVNIMMPGH